jgi:hypothetical protein
MVEQTMFASFASGGKNCLIKNAGGNMWRAAKIIEYTLASGNAVDTSYPSEKE